MIKISVVTVCYNSAKTIERTLASVSKQIYPNLEHVIVDGASNDPTLEIVHLNNKSNLILLSEPDNGIYDAMNKGIKIATGDVIGTLNADDFYIDNSVLSKIAKVFEDELVDACFADLVYVDRLDTERVVRYWKSQEYESGLFKKGWVPAHPTFFARRSVYEQYGLFDLNYKIAADFEFLFRLIEQNKIKTVYIPKVLVKMRLGGTTNKNISNILTQNKEIFSILKRHYPEFSMFKFISLKVYNRLKQFFTRPS